ncbi:MAG: 4-hydroxythreonine-4-phosphate dehydrogenase PdxA [Alphaproteobacteria bacterium]|nr:4-hydroxythreonine-4-phosphate dehydrogenase PdxA [Alphaproteobacteria bacterium]
MAAPLALTMGDPAGIGGELTLKAWRALHRSGPTFVAIDNPERLAALAARLGMEIPLHRVEHPREADFALALPVLRIPLAAAAEAGRPDPANGAAVTAAIERAVRLALEREVAGVVTNPISKATLYQSGFAYPGHTEFLGVLTGTPEPPVMMLVSPGLRVVPVTVHVALRRALDMLDMETIAAAARTAAQALRTDFGIAAPRLAVAGLNPHAGEAGALGDEEERIIAPAIARLREQGIAASGPWPPDTMFTPQARGRYDAAICMYHDQALIPLKTLDVTRGVNVTLGLPIVRTSPDHGTAFDIAGEGIADPSSLIAAIRLAADLAARRTGATA